MGVKKYFAKQFKASKLLLEHDDVSDFYISCFQRNFTAVPLLCIRTVIFAGCLSILTASIVLTTKNMMEFRFWFIYMTHWGVALITITSGFGFFVSLISYTKGQLEQILKLPWYVAAYWVLSNITVTLAFFITAFYYAFLSGMDDVDFAVSSVLDFFVHGMNSILMLLLLMTSRQPMNILHFYIPVVFALIYLAFNIIYYYAGGLDPRGNTWIYPNLDWEKPGEAAVMCVLSAVFIIVIHFVVVALSLLRDYITRGLKNKSTSLNFS